MKEFKYIEGDYKDNPYWCLSAKIVYGGEYDKFIVMELENIVHLRHNSYNYRLDYLCKGIDVYKGTPHFTIYFRHDDNFSAKLSKHKQYLLDNFFKEIENYVNARQKEMEVASKRYNYYKEYLDILSEVTV